MHLLILALFGPFGINYDTNYLALERFNDVNPVCTFYCKYSRFNIIYNQ